jgi:hypothetical protein
MRSAKKAIDNEAKKVQRQLRLEEAAVKRLQRQETAASAVVARATKVRQKEMDKDNQ